MVGSQARRMGCGSLALVVLGCSDSAVPVVEHTDQFSITPSSLVVRPDTSPQTPDASTSGLVTIVALSESGRPAESAHFNVKLGGCAQDEVDLELVSLLPAAKCELRSGSLLQCITATQGTAQFAVQGHGPGTARVAVTSARDDSVCRELMVSVVDRLPTGAAVQIRGLPALVGPDPDARLSEQFLTCGATAPPSCAASIRRIAFDVAFAASGSLIALPYDTTVSISTSPAENAMRANAWLSMGDCDGPPARVLDAKIGRDQAASEPLYLCVDGAGGTHSISAAPQAEDYRIGPLGVEAASTAVTVLPQPAHLAWERASGDGGAETWLLTFRVTDCAQRAVAIEGLQLTPTEPIDGTSVTNVTAANGIVQAEVQTTSTALVLLRGTIPITGATCLIPLDASRN